MKVSLCLSIYLCIHVGYRVGVCYHGDGAYSIVGDLQNYEVHCDIQFVLYTILI